MKYQSGDKVRCNCFLLLHYRKKGDESAGVAAGTILTVQDYFEYSDHVHKNLYHLKTSKGESIVAPASAFDLVSESEPRNVVLYNEAKGCLYRVTLITETEKSFFAGRDGNECVYMKSNWVILEGGLEILQMVNATGQCIRIVDAISLYKAGFRKVEV